MSLVTFDVNNPPLRAPGELPDRLVWALARQVWQDHQQMPGTPYCRTCPPATRFPCHPQIFALSGLRIGANPDAAPTTEHPHLPARRGVPVNPHHNGPGGRPDQWPGYVEEAIPPLRDRS